MSFSVRDENEYEDLLALWSDLESGLGVILGSPSNTQEFAKRVLQYDRWMQSLMQRDADVGLYVLFQLASNSPVGYSASHALVCAVLCHLIAKDLALPPKEHDSLVHAAFTMNIAMTSLQDTLAKQVDKPTPAQQDTIRTHAVKGGMMLANLGVADDDWLDIVCEHHNDAPNDVPLGDLPVAARLTRILKVVDRYAAMVSPRASRLGRSASESARSVMAQASADTDAIGHALVRCVGLCPPGTFVRLESGALAIVVLRSDALNQPFVAVLSRSNGDPLPAPLLHNTANCAPRIESALEASAVRVRLHHFQILRLGAYAAQHG
jgi:HD-GYP domain-containing protein (c-di-GMP phosphodiesterase class II)